MHGLLLQKTKKKLLLFVNTLQNILDRSSRKPNKIWVDQGDEFYNKLFKTFLKLNNIEIYSTYNEGDSVVTGRFIRTLKSNIFKHMTVISKKVFPLMC